MIPLWLRALFVVALVGEMGLVGVAVWRAVAEPPWRSTWILLALAGVIAVVAILRLWSKVKRYAAGAEAR